MYSTVFTVLSNTSFNAISNAFETRDSRCNKQHKDVIVEFFFFAKVISPLTEPTIEGPPSVQISTHWTHIILDLCKYGEIE